MSRNAKFTAKLVAGLTPHEKMLAAIYGDKRDPKAIQLLYDWRKASSYIMNSWEIQRLGPDEYQKHVAADLSQRRAACLEKFGAHIDDAIRAGDGSFFRAFADAIEKQCDPADLLRLLAGDGIPEYFNPANKLRAVIGITVGVRALASWARLVTLKDLHQGIQELGISVDKDRLRRICREMGLALAHDKIGRPKSSQDKIQKKCGRRSAPK